MRIHHRSIVDRSERRAASLARARCGARRAIGIFAVGLFLVGAGPKGSHDCVAQEETVATEPEVGEDAGSVPNIRLRQPDGLQIIVMPGAPIAPENAVPQAELSPDERFRQLVEQQALQYEPMVQNALMCDLELLRTLHADLPIESRRRIAAAGSQAVKEAALSTSEAINDAQRPRGVPVKVAGDLANGVAEFFNIVIGLQPLPPDARRFPAKDPEPFEHLRTALIASVVEELGQEAGENLADEFTKREQRRRQACVRRLVATLDEFLSLTSKQRQEIEESLGQEWQEGIAMAAESQMNVNGKKVFLGLPYKRVRPHLTAAQKKQLGNGKESQGMEEANRHQLWQSRLWRHMNMGQQAERDPWWFE